MANELKRTQWQYWTEGRYWKDCTKEYAESLAKINVNVREISTCPAAPVEGLETVGATYMGYLYSLPGKAMWPAQSEELVTRSQAEAIIAALQSDVEGSKSVINHLTQRSEKAEARIKELGAELDQAVGVIEDRSSECKTLETQLAAARKALEFYSNLENWKNGRFEQVQGGTVLRHHPSSAHKDRGAIARAVLGGKPSC